MQITVLLPVVFAWCTSAILFFLYPHRIQMFILAALGTFLSGALTIGYLVADYFTGEGITDAVLFHVIYGVEGAGLMEYQELLLATAVALISLFLLSTQLLRRRRQPPSAPKKAPIFERASRIAINSLAYGCLFFSIAAHPAVLDTLYIVGQYNVDADFDQRIAEMDSHIHPVDVRRRTERPKNIVYLYAESVERTYFDTQRFPGLITNLRQLEQQALTFTDIKQTQLTDWTIAGMTASQCGIPLSPFNGRHNDLGQHETFLPGATCMGDILAREGYHLSYIGGADLEFAGKGIFYKQHHFHEVEGLHELNAHLGGNVPVSKWGIYDDMLLDRAYQKYISLAEQQQPFGLFLLTLDTHSPSGHESPACRHIRYQDGKNKILNAVACADHLIHQFAQRVLSSPYAEDTVLIIASDHLAMRNDATELLEETGGQDRTNMFMAFGTDISPAMISKPGSTLDIGPTVLDLLGFDTRGFAFGRNLRQPEPTLVETMGLGTLNEKILDWRMNLWRYWVSANEPA